MVQDYNIWVNFTLIDIKTSYNIYQLGAYQFDISEIWRETGFIIYILRNLPVTDFIFRYKLYATNLSESKSFRNYSFESKNFVPLWRIPALIDEQRDIWGMSRVMLQISGLIFFFAFNQIQCVAPPGPVHMRFCH